MKNLFILILSVLVILLSCERTYRNSTNEEQKPKNSKGITIEEIDSIAKEHQSCLDMGEQMFYCSRNYFYTMDSCLDVEYLQLSNKLNKTSYHSLKTDQEIWKKQQKQEYQKIDSSYPEEGRDYDMMQYNEYAEFIKNRLILLVERY